MSGLFWMVIGGALLTLVNKFVQDKSPNIIIKQYYNTVSAAQVPQKIGDLELDYEKSSDGSKGVHIIEILNKGNASEEDLRVQATFPQGTNPKFLNEPDLRVYDPGEMNLDDNKFFVLLKNFPINALAPIQFVPPENKQLLCNVKIKSAGKTKEWMADSIEGVECD